MSVFKELTDRGLIAQTTGEQAVREMIDAGKAVFYIGIDPTADSLHVGHFLPLLLMRHLQRAGNRPIALQCGGDDQWSNMLGGTELIRRKLAHDANALTIPLLLTKAGHKMGKTMGGAVWLDREKTSPFDFYQYFRNVDDADVIRFLRMLTFVPLPEIAAMEAWEGAQLNAAKERLAYELTALVHSTEDAVQAQEAARALFTSGQADNMPSCTLTAAQVPEDGLPILDLLLVSGVAPSKKEARRLIEQGGIEINEQKVGDFTAVFDKAALSDGITVKKGKKSYLRVVYES